MTTVARWSLTGRRALVTGGSKGIGAAVAEELLTLGATVTVVARGSEELNARLEAWRAEGHGDRVFGTVGDVATPEGRDQVLAFVRETMGGLEILVNNVGTNVRKPSLQITPDEYERVFATNLTATWEMCRGAYPLLSESSDGASIVQIGSVAGTRAIGSGAPYAMTKAAIDELTRYLAVEWAEQNIRVNAVNPWYTNTPLASAVLAKPAFEATIRRHTPLDRIADPQDIAGLVAFLCLPAARHITGQTIAVDGGFLAYALPFSTFAV